MNGKAKTDGAEILYLDEIHDEVSTPLRSDNLEPIHHSINLRAGFSDTGSEADNPRSRRPSFAGTEIDDIDSKSNTRLDVKPPAPSVGFDNRNGPEFPPSNWSGSIFPSPGQTVQLTTPDVNVYQHKKTLAQGMMDLALLSANANQMRYVLQTDGLHPYFFPALTLIGMSLFLQIAVGIGLIWNSVYNIKQHEQMCKANKANNWTVIGIFLVTIFNVFISSFGVVDQIQPAAAVTTT